VEIAETYSTESFLMAVRRFMALHGAPKRFQSDQGTQLVAASKQLATWDWTAVHEITKGMNAEWHIVPTGGRHYNGQAERLIGLLKRCLEGTLNSRRLTLGELNTVVAEAAQMVNSRPIAKNTGDPETGGPITPLHLQLGRATVEVPNMKFEEAPRLTQRLQFIEEAKRQFWKKWCKAVFFLKKCKTNYTGLRTVCNFLKYQINVSSLLYRNGTHKKSNLRMVRYMFEVLPFNEYTRDLEQRFLLGPPGCAQTSPYLSPGLLDFLVV
jgi:hypothetical protein